MNSKLKKIISSVLTVAMVFGLVCNSGVFPAFAEDACGYTPAMTMSDLDLKGEDAVSGSCYSISSAYELQRFAQYVNNGKPTAGVTFYMTADISLADVEWTPIASASSKAFEGVFDGCGYAVLKLTDSSEKSSFALFGYVEGTETEIKNLGVQGEITGKSDVAGIVAFLKGGKLANCWSAVDITGTYTVGGIAANVEDGIITNCCSYGYVSGTSNVGAIAGVLKGTSTVEYSYYIYYGADKGVGNVSSNSTQTVYRFSSSSTEVLTEKELTVDNKTTDNLIALLNEWLDLQEKDSNYREWTFDTSVTGKTRVDGRYPSLIYPDYIAPVDSYYTATASMTALSEAKQDAVSGKCYSISSSDELKLFRDYVNAGYNTEGVTFFQNADILVTNSIDQWTPIGNDKDIPFKGIYDGQGYVLTGIFIADRAEGLGLFGYINSRNAMVKNVGLQGLIEGGDDCGAIVGVLTAGAVSNCWFDGELTALDRVGGIVGSADEAQIFNCVNYAKIVGDSKFGGIVGTCTNNTTIKYCYYTSDNTSACGKDSGTQTAVVAFTEDGTDYTLERSVVVGSASGIKLLNVLNHWVTYLAMDDSYRSWKIDDSVTGTTRILGTHPTHLYPGDNIGVKRVDEPQINVDGDKNPYNVHYTETATMTELYDSGLDAVAGGHYSISTGQELELLSKYVKALHSTKDATFYLTHDVDISVNNLGNDSEGWLPIGCDYSGIDSQSYNYVFRGTFDGCGYTVTGLYIYNEKGDNVGLFGRIRDCTIKNLGVVGGIVGEWNCGGLVGKSDSSTIVNCWTSVSIQSESETGGIVGRMDDTTLINCVNYGAVLCYGGETCKAGGVFGDSYGKCVVKNCYYLKDTATVAYNTASSSTTTDILGFTYEFVDDDYRCTLERATQIEEITTTSLLDALNAWVQVQNCSLYAGWYDSTTLISTGDHSGHYPRLMSPGEYQGQGENEDYSGDYTATATMSELYSTDSDGIAGCYYSINGLDELEYLQKYVAKGHATKDIIFFLTRDLDMSAKYHVDGNSWHPIGDTSYPFQGIFDGQGYTIKYIYINTGDDDQGLFGHTNNGAVIKNLGISGVVRASTNAGSIVGDFNFSTVANCWSSCEVIATSSNAGGIVGGANRGTIVNCTSYGEVTSTAACGAIAGLSFTTEISYCYYLYGSCLQAVGTGSTAITKGVEYFNGTSSACIMNEKVNVEGTETKNALSALKLYVDAHPETNYCYWVIGNTEEYLLMGVAFFPVLLSASGTMGEKDYKEVQAYFDGQPYYSVIKAINAANDSEGGGEVILATNVVFYVHDDVTLDDDVRIFTGNYSAVIKSNVRLYSLQQLIGYFTVKEGGKVFIYDSDKADYSLFMYSQKEADASCNSIFYSNQALTFQSNQVSAENDQSTDIVTYRSPAYNLSLEDGVFTVNSSLDSGNPHGIPAGSTITVQSHATLNVSANARIRTTGGATIQNYGTVKIGNATLDRNSGIKMVGVFEDDGGTVTLPYIYKEGYTLRGWSIGSDTTKLYAAGSTVDVTSETTFVAQWKLGTSADPYPGDDSYEDEKPIYDIPITVIQSTGGTVTPGTLLAAKGQNITFTVTADSDYSIKSFIVDGQFVELDENYNYQLVSVSREHTVIAFFTKTVAASYSGWDNPFSDISSNDWYYQSVRYCAAAGLFNGTAEKTFSPEDTITREMMVTVLWRLAGSPVIPNDIGSTFSDVPADSYAYDAIRWAALFNIVQGYGDGTFGYNDAITREQLVTIIFRFAKNYTGVDVSQYDSTNIISYSDVLQISHGMAQPFQWAVGAGIVNGTTNTTLEPKGLATRGQAATVMYRFCSKFVNIIPDIGL